MPGHARRLVLTVHVIASVGWLGLEGTLVALLSWGGLTHDPQARHAAYLAAGRLAGFLYAPVSLLSLVTGLLLAVGTPWGLVRYWWVETKFVINLALVVGGIFVVTGLLERAGDLSVGGVPDSTRYPAFGAICVGVVLLVVATTLSVVKPWGRTAYGRGLVASARTRGAVSSSADTRDGVAVAAPEEAKWT